MTTTDFEGTNGPFSESASATSPTKQPHLAKYQSEIVRNQVQNDYEENGTKGILRLSPEPSVKNSDRVVIINVPEESPISDRQ